MYWRILVALDGSALAERVLTMVEPLAEKFQSTVILLRATTPLEDVIAVSTPTGVPMAGPPTDVQPIVEAEEQGAAEYLEAVAQRLRSRGLTVQCEVPAAKPAAAIVEAARQHGADLIAMTTHGRSGLGRLVFGSVADEVLRNAPCPILLVRITEEG